MKIAHKFKAVYLYSMDIMVYNSGIFKKSLYLISSIPINQQ